MKYIISALLVVLALVSCAGAQFTGNYIDQKNYESAYASGQGSITEKEANWAVVCGDKNALYQDNTQSAAAGGTLDMKFKSTNIALVVGSVSNISQWNDPSAVDVTQLNEILVIGMGTAAVQENTAAGSIESGTVKQDQNNFGVIFGAGNYLVQTNDAYANNSGNREITQTEANAAYVYGYKNNVNQDNTLKGYAEMEGGTTNQTAKNLAFAISSSPCISYIPACEAFTLQPSCNGSTQVMQCPGIPEFPCPPALDIDFPLDP